MRSMIDSLLQSVNKISEINKKIAQIDNKEPDNKFTDNMRSMIDLLLQSVNKVLDINKKISQIDNKISHATLIKKFLNTYQLCNKDLNKFNLLLKKGVYPYKYMESWEKFNGTSLPDKEYFHSELNKEHITDKDYLHAQKVWNTF